MVEYICNSSTQKAGKRIHNEAFSQKKRTIATTKGNNLKQTRSMKYIDKLTKSVQDLHEGKC
jgi:hypothetical protein